MKLASCCAIFLIHNMIGLSSLQKNFCSSHNTKPNQESLPFRLLVNQTILTYMQESSSPQREHDTQQTIEGVSSATTLSYAGAQVWRTDLSSPEHRQLIDQLIEDGDISIWRQQNDVADYMVLETNKVKVNRHLQTSGLNHTVLILNVERRIQDTRALVPSWTNDSLRLGHRLNFEEYPSIGVIDEYINFLERNYGSIATIRTVGNSVESRPIKMITISNGNPSNKGILVTGGLHAREWVAVTSALYLIHELTTNFDDQPDYVRSKDWHIIPIVNPDGYEYTQQFDRMWRKNRVFLRSTGCHGVDINRNFDTHWVRKTNECDDTYSGKTPFSEPESAAVRDAVLNLSKKPNAYVDLHSYGQMILYPWSSGLAQAKNKYVLNYIGKGISKTMEKKSNNHYKVGTASEIMYPTRGSAVDWCYGTGIPLAYGIEGPDVNHGFLMPKKLIRATGEEIFSAVKLVAQKLNASEAKDSDEVSSWL